MAILKGEVTFKVTFTNQGVPVGLGQTSAIIYHECAKQIYASAPWSEIKAHRKYNFKVEMTEKIIESEKN